MKRILIAIVVLVSLPGFLRGATPEASPVTFTFDAAGSALEVEVQKAGLLKAFGHDHRIAAKEFSGRVTLDPGRMENSGVVLKVAAKSLSVMDEEVSEKDRSEIQATMQGEKVLDAERFPEIEFSSTGVTQVREEPDGWAVTLAGRLRLHGLEREVILPVTLRREGSVLYAEGEVFLLQSDYGITPVKVAGGMVKVQDRLRIHFAVRARSVAP